MFFKIYNALRFQHCSQTSILKMSLLTWIIGLKSKNDKSRKSVTKWFCWLSKSVNKYRSVWLVGSFFNIPWLKYLLQVKEHLVTTIFLLTLTPWILETMSSGREDPIRVQFWDMGLVTNQIKWHQSNKKSIREGRRRWTDSLIKR